MVHLRPYWFTASWLFGLITSVTGSAVLVSTAAPHGRSWLTCLSPACAFCGAAAAVSPSLDAFGAESPAAEAGARKAPAWAAEPSRGCAIVRTSGPTLSWPLAAALDWRRGLPDRRSHSAVRSMARGALEGREVGLRGCHFGDDCVFTLTAHTRHLEPSLGAGENLVLSSSRKRSSLKA